MSNEFINHYLSTCEVRYDDKNYLAFINRVGLPPLPKIIHIGGTNGKGSTALYLANALLESGYKVGLYTSPHFFAINELARISTDTFIDDAFIELKIKEYGDLFALYRLSAAEVMTYISFLFFSEAKLDFLVLEVMMGGSKDTTNVVTPFLTIITSIGEDHIKELGPTLADIASHKAGIIKERVPLVCGLLSEVAQKVVVETATKKHAPIINPEAFSVVSRDLHNIVFKAHNHQYRLASGALYEVKNAMLVLKAIEILKTKGLVISETAINKAFNQPTLRGRFRVVKKSPLVLIDGAHNPPAMIELLNDLKSLPYDLHVVYATFKDKDYVQALNLLSLCAKSITLTTFNHPRALTSFNDSLPFFDDHVRAIKHLLPTMGPNDLLLIVGSLYFSGIVEQEFEDGIYE